MTNDKYSSGEYQEKVGKLVEREVIYCVSSLISNLYANDKYMDELYPVIVQDDFESAAQEASESEKCGNTWDKSEQTAQEFCQDNDIDPHQSEIYEHWIVSSWLADKLEAKGEAILRDFMGIDAIWGRACTGQAILLDKVICDIYDELHKKENSLMGKAKIMDALVSIPA